jgi:hypothetical protein
MNKHYLLINNLLQIDKILGLNLILINLKYVV